MSDFANATPYGAFAIPSCDRDGRDVLVVVAAARFGIPPPGQSELTLTAEQPPPPRTDLYWGAPGESSLRLEGQVGYTRRTTDIYVAGHAHAPTGHVATQLEVAIAVGACAVHLRVSGDRQWERSTTRGVVPSQPEAFTRMPLVWERAFGGAASSSTPRNPVFEPRNPIGCGLEVDAESAVGKRLPNIEDSRDPLQKLGDRPTPAGVCPVARAWQPRASYAGTYDEVWRRNRAPLWPADFDERFFSAAPEPLQARPHLRGGEHVALRGLHPDGIVAFQLPIVRLVARTRFLDGRVERRILTLDGVFIDMDAAALTLFFRGAVDAPLSFVAHQETLLRQLDTWEVRA